MHSTINICLMIILMLSAFLTTAQVYKGFSLNPKQRFKNTECTMNNNETGICIDKSMCNNAHQIDVGGRISDSELRTSSDCNNNEWCCSKKNINSTTEMATKPNKPQDTTTAKPEPKVTTLTPNKEKRCIVSNMNDCPWLVKLYRENNYPYCLGALIGSHTILTTATCLIQARDQPIWARVPGSANPEANYTIVFRLKHPNFNSGTRSNDQAILGTETNVEGKSGVSEGACIDTNQSLGGECVAANIDDYDELYMVAMFVTPGSCTGSGNVADAMCANGSGVDNLFHGAPIMCPKNNMYMLTGLTKTAFRSSKALLGNIDYNWLIHNLKSRRGLTDADFLYNLNY